MGFAAICSFLRPALGLLLAWGIAGCASAPPPLALQQQGIKRIAVARPAFADHSLILGAHGGGLEAPTVYREFCDALEEQLRANGFVVVDYCSRPNTAIANLSLHIPAVEADEADAILVPNVKVGYAANSGLHPYALRAFGDFALVDTGTRKLVASGPMDDLPPGAKSYWKLDELIADMAAARVAAQRAGAALGKSMGARIR